LSDVVWLTVDVPVHPKGVQWGSGLTQASQRCPTRTVYSIALYTGAFHAETLSHSAFW